MRITIAKCLFLYEILLVIYLFLFNIPYEELRGMFNPQQWGSVELMVLINVLATSFVFWILIFRNEDSFFNRGFTIGSSDEEPKKRRSKSKKKKRKEKKQRKVQSEEDKILPLY